MEKDSFTHKYQSLTLEWPSSREATSNLIWMGRHLSPMPKHIQNGCTVEFEGLNKSRMSFVKGLARRCGGKVKE